MRTGLIDVAAEIPNAAVDSDVCEEHPSRRIDDVYGA